VPDSLGVGLQRVLVAKMRASTAREAGDPARCEQLLDSMAAHCDRLHRRFPDSVDLPLQANEIPNERAHARAALGRTDEQLALLAESLAMRRALAGERPDQPLVRQSIASQCLNLADALRQHDREPERAAALYDEGLAILTGLVPPPDVYYFGPMHAEMLVGRGAMARRFGKLADAERDLRDGIAHVQAMLATSPRAVRRARTLLDACAELAILQFDRGDRAAATATIALANDAEAMLEASAKTAPPDRLLLKFRSTKARLAQ
jgi:hypothetical protein